VPDQAQVEEIIQVMGCSPAQAREPGMRFRAWELRCGQRVTVVGVIHKKDGGIVIAKAEGQPMIVTTLDESSLDVQTTRQSRPALFWAAILGIPGLFVLIVAGIEWGKMLVKLVSK
jgi:hypothetical protein